VIDSRDFLMNPRPMLEAMCDQFGIPYLGEMTSWPPGRRDSDGVWGKYWYDSVWKSTSFEPYRDRKPDLGPALRKIADAAEPFYQSLYRQRLVV